MKEANIITVESESGFRVLFEYATIGILVVGDHGKINIINPSAEKLFGYSNAELMGQSIEILLPDYLKTKHVHHREEYFNAPKARPMGLDLELYARKKDGTVIPVEISLGHYKHNDERLAVAFVTDISRRKESEQQLIKITEDLENLVTKRTIELSKALEHQKDLSAIKSRFVSMASHEFRTPLSSVLTSISLLESYLAINDTEKSKKHIERIKSSIFNMTGILDDFLSVEKLEQGKIEVTKEPIQLNEFYTDLSEELTGSMKPGQKISTKHKGTTVVLSDKKILRTILLNLLSNAVKYSGSDKEVQLLSVAKDNLLTIEIKDQGIGIPEDEQSNLFSPFFRAKNTASIQGTGLGLSIVKRYTHILGGSISYTSKHNEGSVFKFQIAI